MNITAVEKSHIDSIVAIENQAHTHPWPASQFEQRLNQANQYSWCVHDEGRLVAYCFVSQVVDQVELLNIAVDPQMQGRGYGRQLMEFFMQALPKPYSEIFLEVRESNDAAIGMYEQLGFNEMGRREGYYPAKKGREDALILGYHSL